MLNESNRRQETIADKLYVPIEQLIPGINTEGLQGVATPIGKRSPFDPEYTGKYERMPRPVHDEAKYGEVIDKSTEYMDFVLRASEDEQQRIFFEKFKDQVVVDLAAGAWFTDTHSWISQFGCRGYVPVEPYWADPPDHLNKKKCMVLSWIQSFGAEKSRNCIKNTMRAFFSEGF